MNTPKRAIKGLKEGLKNGRKAYWLDFYVSGKRITKFAGYSKTEARNILDKMRGKILDNKLNGTPLELEKKEKGMLIDNELNGYLAYSKLKKKPRSYERDITLVEHLKKFFKGKKLDEITPKDVRDFQACRTKEVSNATCNREVSL